MLMLALTAIRFAKETKTVAIVEDTDILAPL